MAEAERLSFRVYFGSFKDFLRSCASSSLQEDSLDTSTRSVTSSQAQSSRTNPSEANSEVGSSEEEIPIEIAVQIGPSLSSIANSTFWVEHVQVRSVIF